MILKMLYLMIYASIIIDLHTYWYIMLRLLGATTVLYMKQLE